MRTLAHISDLHFGTEEPALVEGLLTALDAAKPDFVVVSGDLTQRAKREQFAAAKVFLDRIPFPYMVVPGNHDIPLYDVMRRALRPLHRFRRYITSDLKPAFVDDEIAILGINTARAAALKDGRISLWQIKHIADRFNELDAKLFKVLVTHHPFIPPESAPTATVVKRGALALEAMKESGCELILAGHLHLAYSGEVRSHHVAIKRSVMVAQAGTVFSHRRRGEANAFNLITIDRPSVKIEVQRWNGEQFAPDVLRHYMHTATGGWRLEV
jgi:3',5'-cyclic AMP phosphodiesterase CpdA